MSLNVKPEINGTTRGAHFARNIYEFVIACDTVRRYLNSSFLHCTGLHQYEGRHISNVVDSENVQRDTPNSM